MSFNSSEFVLWLGALFLLFQVGWVRQHWKYVLLGASLLFYAYNGPFFLAVFLVGMLANYGFALKAARPGWQKKAWVAVAVLYNLGVLGYFKYRGWFLEGSFYASAGTGKALELILPIGISFHTFQGLGYVLDVASGREKEPQGIIQYLLFSAFFPTQIAGPILRWSELAPQIEAVRWTPRWQRAVYFWAQGALKKMVFADLLASLVDPVFAAPAQASVALRGAALLGYSLQIYMDFSGYCDIAEGCASAFGLRLVQNFKSPYMASSLRDFWRRWHITLSRWLRDHLYIPLGGSKQGKAWMVLALMGTMVIGGLWHGADGMFLIWGAFHGAGLVLEHLSGRSLGRGLTFLYVTFGWIFFRIHNGDLLREFLSAPGADFRARPFVLLLGLTTLAWAYQAHEAEVDEETWSMAGRPLSPLKASMVVVLCTCAALVTGDAGGTFIYFQF